eukprot:774104-Pyramimonas_sp.AAC.1
MSGHCQCTRSSSHLFWAVASSQRLPMHYSTHRRLAPACVCRACRDAVCFVIVHRQRPPPPLARAPVSGQAVSEPMWARRQQDRHRLADDDDRHHGALQPEERVVSPAGRSGEQGRKTWIRRVSVTFGSGGLQRWPQPASASASACLSACLSLPQPQPQPQPQCLSLSASACLSLSLHQPQPQSQPQPHS